MTDPYRYFRLEARELIDQLGRGILELEKAPGQAATIDAIQRLLRHAHTLKGAARVVRQPEIADRAHAIEGTLAPYRDAHTALPREHVTTLLALVDEIAQRVAALAAPPPAPASDARARMPEPPPPALHAEAADLDLLLDGVVETHARIAAIRDAATGLDRARRLGEVLIAQLARNPDKAHGVAEELRDVLAAGARAIDAGIDHVERELGQVREHAESLRLVPAEAIFPTLERTARDAATALGKQVQLAAHVTGHVRLDAPLLAAIQQALVQLVRNAVAHGIEAAPDRAAAGKPPKGRIAVEVARRGRRVVFTCRDDGRGIDLEAVRAIARMRGAPGADELRADELLALLLRGGISTAADVTEVAGRGIGLDIVREAIARFGGEITVVSERGTAFELVVPASLASIDALVVEAGGRRALIPLDAVRATRRLADGDIARTARDESIIHDGAATPYHHLAGLLGGAPAGGGDRRAIGVLVAAGGAVAAIGVDRLYGSTSAVVRPIPEVVAADPLIAGASLDTAGTPRLVLDPDRLVAAARRERAIETRPAPVRKPVLVIDDSLTTRMLEQSILETAGYEVDTAVSAEDGLAAARRKRYALFLVDVEMPGMDGFTFIERIRADAMLRDIPAILVTSRASPEDRARGADVGAQGYIVKSEFDQADLLARIQRMVS